MLTRLSIYNYVLIDELSIEFKAGFTSITGETGAGKSIILGALGLVLGDRSDTKCLGNKNIKCSVEAEFFIENYSLDHFFSQHDLDFFPLTILRREISPSGRSRAFINDTPVNVGVLKALCSFLIDIHSQHQSLLINKQTYQLSIIDAYSQHNSLLKKYKIEFDNYIDSNKQLLALKEKERSIKKEMDYKQFLLDEINSINPSDETDANLENELSILENFEEINDKLSQSLELGETNDLSIRSMLNQTQSILQSLEVNDAKLTSLSQRISSLNIEFNDCLYELNAIKDQYTEDYDPKKIAILRDRVGQINQLLHKHSLQNVDDLLTLQTDLQSELNQVFSISKEIEQLEKECLSHYEKAMKLANELSASRQSNLSQLEKEITLLTSSLGMPQSKFAIKHSKNNHLKADGIDEFLFNFSANKGISPNEISKIASGGELSRLMLCFKYILAQKTQLSSILFDEIDTGVSGEIAHKMAELMKKMATNMQVIGITHLPQVAAKANYHFLVAKKQTKTGTKTTLKELRKDERVQEIAKMLSGKSITDSSIKNAIDLLSI